MIRQRGIGVMNKEIESNPQRLCSLDILKTIAIFLVITLHAGVWKTDFLQDGIFDFNQWMQYSFRLLAEGVPLFFMVNGYLLFRKKSFDFDKHIKKIVNIAMVYALWNILLTLNQVLTHKEAVEFQSMVRHFISGDYTSILWFFKSLIFVYILFPVIKHAFDKEKKLYQSLFLIVLLFTVGSRFIAETDVVLKSTGFDFLTGISGFLYEFLPLSSNGMTSLCYFMLGGMLLDYEGSVKEKRIKWIIAGFIAWIVEIGWHTILSNLRGATFGSFWFGNICEIIICIGLFAVFMNIKLNKSLETLFKITGDTTMAVYLLHTIFLSRIYNPLGGVLGRLAFSAFIGIICVVIGFVLGKIPYVKRIIKI